MKLLHTYDLRGANSDEAMKVAEMLDDFKLIGTEDRLPRVEGGYINS